MQWPVQTAEPFSGRGCRLSPAVDSLICPLLGTKDEYSFISSTEEQNESKRLNVLGEGGNGEQSESNITDVLFSSFFLLFCSYLTCRKFDFVLHIQDGLSANGCSELKAQSPCSVDSAC